MRTVRRFRQVRWQIQDGLAFVVKGTRQDHRRRFGRTNARQEMREVVAHRECRGGEHEGAATRIHVSAEPVRHFERRELRIETAWTAVHPFHAIVRVGGHQFAQASERFCATPREGLGHRLLARGFMQMTVYRVELGGHVIECLEEGVRELGPVDARTAGTHRPDGGRNGQFAGFQPAAQSAIEGPTARQLLPSIACQRCQRPRRHSMPEKLRRNLRHLMGFIQHHGIRTR